MARTQLSLTAAEIALLLPGSGAETRPATPVTRALGLTDAELVEPALQSALGSLLIRGLATPDGERIRHNPAVAAVAVGIGRPRFWIQLGLVSERGSDGAVLFDAGGARFLVMPRAFRCFDIVGLDLTADVRDPVVELVRRFLTDRRPAVASMKIEVPVDATSSEGADIPVAADARWVTVAMADDGRWTCAAGCDPDNATVGLAEDEAIGRLRTELAAALPDRVAVPETPESLVSGG
ncbi:MAG: hypothetical protein HKP61_10835 [Dactylosporangium sp.]|nr:hypothetical protein [Dactylosporangium sp.]NNJ61424.1 hypothetical protein [Dactylosporangium sp.]